MNLSSTLAWLTMILWLLRNPEAKAREGISEEADAGETWLGRGVCR